VEYTQRAKKNANESRRARSRIRVIASAEERDNARGGNGFFTLPPLSLSLSLSRSTPVCTFALLLRESAANWFRLNLLRQISRSRSAGAAAEK
jgi:hypothetical protein